MSSNHATRSVSSSDSSSLHAGVVEIDITPPAGLPMWGYAAREGTASGAMDSLCARVLFLSTEETRIAIVVADLGRPFGPTSLAKMQNAVKRSRNISHVIFSATHSHSGPVVSGRETDSISDWESAVVEKIVKAIEFASLKSEPVTIGFDRGLVYIGHNRRIPRNDGTIKWMDRNPEKDPTFPYDPQVIVIRIDSLAGVPLALLVHYACHPVIFGPDNLQYSSEFPGVLARTVQDALDASPVCFFLQGAAGDINPYYGVTPLAEEARKWCEWTGKELAQEVIRIAKNIHPEPSDVTSLECVEDHFEFELRWDADSFRKALEMFGRKYFERSAPAIQEKWSLPVTTVLLNKRIALLTMPGEPFIDFQFEWRTRCPVQEPLLLGYTNGYYGYFPTIAAASEGGYGATSATTWVEVGAGESMLNQSLIRVRQMLGHLKREPSNTEW